MAENFKYQQIEDGTSHGEGDYLQRPLRQQRTWVSTLNAFLLGLLTMAAAVVLYSTFVKPEPSHARQLPFSQDGTDAKTGLPLAWSHGDCGNSPEDARARNCQYSIVLHSWLPQSCLTEADIQDAEDMYKDRDWSYETVTGRNLTMDELAIGDYGHFTTTFDWHVTHCMYVWKRLHRILLDPEQELDSYTANYHHTSHCVKMIAGRPEGMKDSGTKIFVKYPKCTR